MQTILDDVAAFHVACNFPILPEPGIPPLEITALQVRMIRENTNLKLPLAASVDDIPKMAEGIVKTIYTLVGMALSHGIDLDEAWATVHAANMARVSRVKPYLEPV